MKYRYITLNNIEFVINLEDQKIKKGDYILYDVKGYEGSTKIFQYLLGKVRTIPKSIEANPHFEVIHNYAVCSWHIDLCQKVEEINIPESDKSIKL